VYDYSDEFARIKVIDKTTGDIETYGLTKEAQSKLDSITKIYRFMPAALFIGSESDLKTYYVLASHANVDIRYSPRNLYEELSKRQTNDLVYESYPKKNTRNCYLDCGELAKVSWKEEDIKRYYFNSEAKDVSDIDFVQRYTSDDNKAYELKHAKVQEEDELIYGKGLFDAILKDWSEVVHEHSFIQKCLGISHASHTKCAFRGHQHFYSEKAIKNSPLMQALKEQKGITASWEKDRDDDYSSLKKPTLLTLQQAPGNPFIPESYGLTYDTCVEVITGKNNDDWALKVINVDVLKK